MLKVMSRGNRKTKKLQLEVAKPSCSLAVVRKLLKTGANVDARNEDDESFLHYAVVSSLPLVELLMEFHIYVDAQNRKGDTPLHVAVKSRSPNKEIIEKLLTYGADVHRRNVRLETPLACALETHSPKDGFRLPEKWQATFHIAMMLVRSGATLDRRDEYGYTPLHLLCKHLLIPARFQDVKEILMATAEAGTSIGNISLARDADSHQSLFRALVSNFKSMEIRVNALDFRSFTLLHHAAALGQTGAILDLIAAGADVSLKTEFGTALFQAVKKSQVEAVRTLLQHGAEANATDYEGLTPLFSAKDPSIITELINHGADVNAWNFQRGTPLFYASDIQCLRALLEAGADVHEKTDTDDTPLHRIVQLPDVGMTLELLSRGADVLAVTKHGTSPIALVANREIAKVLVEHGADVNSVSRSNSPLCRAVSLSDVSLLRYLLSKGARADITSPSPLLVATQDDHYSIPVIKELLNACAHLNRRHPVFDVALFRALLFIQTDVLKEFLHAGVHYDLQMSLSIIDMSDVDRIERFTEAEKDLIKYDFVRKLAGVSCPLNEYHCKSEVKHSRRELRKFQNSCKDEVAKMLKDIIHCDQSAWYSVCKEKASWCHQEGVENKLFKLSISCKYPLFNDILIRKIDRKYLVNQFVEHKLNASNRKVVLGSFCLLHISQYLSNVDLLNMCIALS